MVIGTSLNILTDYAYSASIGALVAGSFAAGLLDPLDRWVRKISCRTSSVSGMC
jgi:hypothetical protein